MRHTATTRRLLLAAALLLTGTFCTPGLTAAQSGSGTSANALSEPTRQELLDTRAKLEELQSQLAEISAAALKNNPPLQEQERELRHLVFNTMKAAGYDPEKEVAHIKELTSKLRSEGIDAEQKKRLVADFQQARARLIEAQREVLDNEEVQQAQQTYQDQMRQAMEEENPDTEALIQRYEETRMQLQRQLEEAARGQD